MEPPASRVVRSVSVFLLGAAVALVSLAVWSQRTPARQAETVTVPAAVGDSPRAWAERVSTPSVATLHDGMYLVGADLQPGTYVTRSILPACYFAVTTDLDGSLESVVTTYFGDAFGRRVELEDGQYFETDECGIWAQETRPPR